MANRLLYPLNTATRQVVDLSGMWKFCFDKQGNGEEEGYPCALPPHSVDMPVPASFADFFTEINAIKEAAISLKECRASDIILRLPVKKPTISLSVIKSAFEQIDKNAANCFSFE